MKHSFKLLVTAFSMLAIASCDKDDAPKALKNDVIKKTVAPIIVGEKVEFAYAMGTTSGKLNAAKVVANIPGAAGTGFEAFSWRTVNAVNISATVATDLVTTNETSTARLIDTNASTLRYFYVVPEAARGKQISFNFSCDNKNGETAGVNSPAYRVSVLDMKKSIALVGTPTGARYFSVADMKAYTLAEVEAGNLSSKIDFVYSYAATITVGTQNYTYAHAFVSPAVTGYFPAGFSIPASWTKRSTMMDKKLNVWDGQLANNANMDIFIDDLDLQKASFTASADYLLDVRANGGVFLKTADGKYTAFIFINSVTNATSTAVIGIKRYTN